MKDLAPCHRYSFQSTANDEQRWAIGLSPRDTHACWIVAGKSIKASSCKRNSQKGSLFGQP